MNRSILVQRSALYKDGWKLRFGQGTLITSVVVASNGKKVNLVKAIKLGEQEAAENFDAMRRFNDSKG